MQGIQDRQKRQDQGGAEQDGKQGAEGIGEILEERIDDRVLTARLRASSSLHVLVGCSPRGFHRGKVLDVVVDRLDGTADDDLVAVARLRDRPQDTVDGFDRVLIDHGSIAQLETQARRAMGQVGDVAGAADCIEDGLCRVGHGCSFR